MQKKTSLKSQKGVISVYVTITIIVFIIILTAIYIAAVSVRKNQIKTLIKVKEVYEQDNDNIESIYKNLKPITITDFIDKTVEENTYTQDKYGNKIVIPKGFKVLANGTQGVVYDWDKKDGTSTGVPVVQDGIVIRHATDLNEFVWVPVGEIYNDAEGNSVTNIKLGRYDTKSSNIFQMDTSTTPPTAPLPKQEADKTTYDSTTVDDLIGTSPNQFFENSSGTYNGITYGGTKFETLGSWISNTIDNGGYYIARYEASYGDEGRANSKTSVGIPLDSSSTNKIANKTNEGLWNWVVQSDASTASKLMYKRTENLGYYSELVNSYAWDTAIIFIQIYEDTDYAHQTSLYVDDNTDGTYQPANTGEREANATIGANTTDKVCNIYDMASNLYEWTTETYTISETPCVARGGCFANASKNFGRGTNSSSNSYFSVGFRPLLNCDVEETKPVTGVILNKTSASIQNGGKLKLIATVQPVNAKNKNVIWTSNNPSVATVIDGVVEAEKVGTAKITATTEEGNYTASCDITVESTVADLTSETELNINTYTQDKYGNPIVIPAGFKILANGTQGVVYDWDKENENSTGIPVVQDGIVIQHKTDLNEFVWIPVGIIKNNAEGSSVTNIKLGRYDTWTMNTSITPPTPPSPKQEASKTEYDTTTSKNIISSYYFENSTGTYNELQYKSTGNFKTLGTWINNTINNGGYYIARYEASYGVNGKAKSKPSTGTPLNHTGSNSTAMIEGQLWNWLTQEEASTAAKAMYPYEEGKEKDVEYYSELVNSYAWDTAIIFIQTYEKDKTTYASTQSTYKNSSYQPANTGERTGTLDKACNIYDMASNVYEFTTETSINSNTPCVRRGGYFNSTNTTNSHNNVSLGYNNFSYGFRTMLDCISKEI